MVEHWCSQHKTIWFKKGKMRGFAHPILSEETGEPEMDEEGKPVWCNEPKPKEEETSKPEPQKWQPRPDNTASIEGQVAAKIFGEWVANKVIPLDHPLAQAVIKWGYQKLGVQPSPAKAPGTQKVQDGAAKVRQAPPASKPVSGTKSLPAGLENDLKTLATKVTGYQRENLIPYLDELSGNLGSESITSAYNKLTEEQQVEFTAQVAADVKLV